MVAAHPASEVVQSLYSAGLNLKLTTEKQVRVTPVSCLTPELREAIGNNKAAIVDWLTTYAANESWNVEIPPDTSPATIVKFRNASLALDASQAYYDHHFNCPTCCAAGRGARYGERCSIGVALWSQYCSLET
jgi:hypothetical protein